MNNLGPVGTIKVSLTIPNIANTISTHLSQKWPDLVQYCYVHDGIYWTGSQVWSWLYSTRPLITSDTDIMCVNTPYNSSDIVKDDFVKNTGLDKYNITTKQPSYSSHTGFNPGIKIHHPQCDIDIWSSNETIQDALLKYPEDSHAHCRIAYSFTKGLVILPNSKGW